MKKTLLLAFSLFLIATVSHAQITKGSVLLGGNIGFGGSKDEYGNQPEVHTFTFNPVLGIAVKENLVTGINIFYNHSKTTNNMPGKQEAGVTGGGLFVRKYVPLGMKFYLYGQGNINYTSNY